MKKIFCALTAVVLTMSLSVPALAASSRVTVKNTIRNSKPISYTYDPEEKNEVVTSIKSLMTVLSDMTRNTTRMQTLTITSDSAEGVPVNFRLRLSLPEQAGKTPSDAEYSALEYYNIIVTEENGSVIYSTNSDKETTNDGQTYKDIPLSTLNTTDTSESKLFNVSVSINKDLTKSTISNAAKKLDWSIVSYTSDLTEETPASESPEPQQTEKPEATPTATPVATAAVTAVTSDKHGNYNLKAGNYIVGQGIDPGRYTMTGSGLVNVYNSAGTLKNTIALKSADGSVTNGADEYVINIAEGERLNVGSEIKLEPYVAPTATPSPTATPRAASSVTSTPRATSAAESAKANPKTGDNAPVASVAVVGIAALAGAVLIALKKRKENN